MRPGVAFSGLSKVALIVAASGITVACSSDVTRFNDPFSNPLRSQQATASAPRAQRVAAVPVQRVESSQLAPVTAQAPFSAPDSALTTGSIADRSTFGRATPDTPAVRQMAMSRTLGGSPVTGGTAGWSPVGGTTIQAASGESIETLSRRYGVPASAIAQANGLSPNQRLAPGQSIVIPTYSMSQGTPTARLAPATATATEAVAPVSAEAPVMAQAPAQTARPVAPRPHSVVRVAPEPAATAPMPAARLGWQQGAQPLATAAAPAVPTTAARPAVTRPATHTVAMGDSLGRIATRYGLTRAELAQANRLNPEQPLRIGQTLALPGGQSSTVAQRPQVAPPVTRPGQTTAAAAPQTPDPRQAVRAAQATPAGRAADRTTTASIPPQTREAPETPAAAVEAPAAQAAAEAPRETAANAQPSFRWPVRGRVVQEFRPGTNEGIKVSVPEGTPVKAAEDGVVAYAGNELRGYGNLVLIRHSNGFVTAYAHNSDLKVRRGEQVRRGQTISHAGQTGSVSSPQLHFEIRRGSTPVDPMTFLRGT